MRDLSGLVRWYLLLHKVLDFLHVLLGEFIGLKRVKECKMLTYWDLAIKNWKQFWKSYAPTSSSPTFYFFSIFYCSSTCLSLSLLISLAIVLVCSWYIVFEKSLDEASVSSSDDDDEPSSPNSSARRFLCSSSSLSSSWLKKSSSSLS